MRTMLTRRAGQPGTKKLMRQYGEDLVCVRYRYDEDRHQRLKTVELIIDRAPWRARKPQNAESFVHVRIEKHEDLLRRALLHAGARWDESTDTWRVKRKDARALGLMTRINGHTRRIRDYD